MRYLLLSSCLLILGGCSSAHKHLQQIEDDASCLAKFKPQFTTTIYNTRVNIIGNYISGLLFIKVMPDSSTRLVFSSEMGLSIFDFEFSLNGDFKVHHIIKKMNRKAVIKTLQEDFKLVSMQNLNFENARVFKKQDSIYYGFPQKNGSNYYITDVNCENLLRIEKASKRKAIVEIVLDDYRNGIPDSIGIRHTNFEFNIGLKRLQ